MYSSVAALSSQQQQEQEQQRSYSYLIQNLIPGKQYFIRVSAANDLGYGSRRLVAPNSITTAVSQPYPPYEAEIEFGTPRVFQATDKSLLVKIGSPKYDGGSITTHFNIEWDTVSTFNSGPSLKALGHYEIPAYSVLCAACIQQIDFQYNTINPVVTISFAAGSANVDIVRQLQTGSRIAIVTTDDNVPYTFVVAETQATTNSFTVRDVGLRQTTFPLSFADSSLYLMGAQYEIPNLITGTKYFVRVSAENSVGVCDPLAKNLAICGAYVSTQPASIAPQLYPAPVAAISASAKGSDIELKWSA